ncbi:MAG TPA: glycosyltransferase family 4 protein [Burkholderiales bacterium]|nr:glycosyltransferase family 4 protein [Burkholderiales bacterium]
MRVAFVLKGYPRLSEAFIAQEIAALERRSLDILIVSLRKPTEGRVHAVHRAIRAQVLYLPEYLLLEPFRVLKGWWRTRKTAGYTNARSLWLKDLQRDPTANRVRRFGQALVLAAELPGDVRSLHAHFLHTPASVTRYGAALLGMPWTGSAHAKDIWTTPEWEKREKLASCEWLVTCTAANREHLAALAPPGRVELVYHGIDLSRFPPRGAQRPALDGAGEPVTILSVCRLVEKKGMEVLLEALGLLPPALRWKLVHAGGGPLKEKMILKANSLGIEKSIEWRGPLTQDELLEEYRKADLFALASRIAGDGDRDGLPNVLAEAQSQALACVATRVSAIPELVRDGQSGVLVPENDSAALARALEALIRDPARRRALGEAGLARVRAEFMLEANLERLARKFGLSRDADRVLRTA